METKQTLDFSSLNRPVSKAEVKAYNKQYKTLDYIVIVGLFFAGLTVLIAFAGWTSNGFEKPQNLLWLLAMSVMSVIATKWIAFIITKKSVLFQRFAQANQYEYTPKVEPNEQGSVFQFGRSKHADSVVSGMYAGRPFWFGTYYCTVGSGKSSRVIITGVLNVTLPRSLPYVMLDGNQNTMRVADGIDKSQQLVLEGDFNTYFKVYCPKDYERDVLYFLTPELMQALIDMDDSFDAEIIGNELYFYTRKTIEPNEKTLKNLFIIAEKIGGELAENARAYQDYRIDKKLGTIAPGGLKLKTSVWPLVFFTAFILACFVMVYTV